MGSFHLSNGETCLRATSLAGGSALAPGACDGNGHRLEDDDGFIYNALAEDEVKRFVRQSDHYPACEAGHGTRLGLLGNHKIGAKLNGSSLVLTTCDGSCVGVDALVTPCTEAAAGGWRKQSSISSIVV